MSDGTNWRGSAPFGTWHPGDNNLIACTFDPRIAKAAGLVLPAGSAILHRLKVPAGAAISTVHAWVGTAGIALTTANAAVYDVNGNLLATTADQSAAWMSTGKKPMPLTTPVPPQTHDREVYVALYAAGKNQPHFLYNGAGIASDFGMNSGPFLCGRLPQGSSTPPTLPLASMTSYHCYLVGLA